MTRQILPISYVHLKMFVGSAAFTERSQTSGLGKDVDLLFPGLPFILSAGLSLLSFSMLELSILYWICWHNCLFPRNWNAKWVLAAFSLFISPQVSLGKWSHRYGNGISYYLRSNILGGNFALVGVPSVGASGAIFGTVAVSYLFIGWLASSYWASIRRSAG